MEQEDIKTFFVKLAIALVIASGNFYFWLWFFEGHTGYTICVSTLVVLILYLLSLFKEE